VAYAFLSDEWIAGAEAIRDRYVDRGNPLPVQVRMNVIITGVPFGEGAVRMYLDTSQNGVAFERGHLDNPEVTVTTDYGTAKALFVDMDQQVGMQAFLAGRVKVQGDLTKLMALQAGPPDDRARQMAEETKDITE